MSTNRRKLMSQGGKASGNIDLTIFTSRAITSGGTVRYVSGSTTVMCEVEPNTTYVITRSTVAGTIRIGCSDIIYDGSSDFPLSGLSSAWSVAGEILYTTTGTAKYMCAYDDHEVYSIKKQ